jgi:hypothetical protein
MTLTPELLAGHAVDQEPYGRIEGHQKAGEGAQDDGPGVDVIQICFVLSVAKEVCPWQVIKACLVFVVRTQGQILSSLNACKKVLRGCSSSAVGLARSL